MKLLKLNGVNISLMGGKAVAKQAVVSIFSSGAKLLGFEKA